MPKVTVPGHGTFDVEKGKKFVLALEDNGVDMLHRCGGRAKCTTCRVEVKDGNFGELNDKETAVFDRKGITGPYRLSCQLRVEDDCTVEPVKTIGSTGLEPGPRPED